MSIRAEGSRIGCAYLGATHTAPAQSFTQTVDPTYQGYVSAITADGKTWTFGAASVFTVRVFSIAGQVEATLDATFFTFGAPSTTAGVTTTIVTGAGLATGLNLKLYITKRQMGYSFRHEVTACPADFAIMWVRFPNFHVLPYGAASDSFATTSYHGGLVLPTPHLYTNASPVCSPPFMAYAGFWDASSKSCLMTWSDDTAWHQKCIGVIGQTTNTLHYWEHIYDRRYTGAQLFAKSYEVHVELFTGSTADGAMCHYDIADRFRMWATDTSRPWMTRGKWKDAADVSQRVVDSSAVVSFGQDQTDWARFTTMLTRFKTHIGATDVLARWYSWNPQSFTIAPPDPFNGAPLSGSYLSELAACQAAGIHVIIYTFNQWLPTLVGDYDPSNYASFGDIRGKFLRTRAGDIYTYGGFAIFDFTETNVRAIHVQLMQDIAAAHGGSLPHGTYVDVFAPATIGGDHEDDPGDTDWTASDHYAGMSTTLRDILDDRRNDDAEHIVTQEWPQLAFIMRSDMQYSGPGPSTSGNHARTTPYIMSEYSRVGSYDQPSIFDPSDGTVVHATTQLMIAEWLASGLISIVDRTTSGTLVASPITGNPFYHLWDFCALIIEANEYCGTYMRGRQMRPMAGVASEAERAHISTYNTLEPVWWASVGWAFPINSAVWQTDDGSLGIIITHSYRSSMPAGIVGNPVPGPRSVTIALGAAEYCLTTGPKVLVRNDSGIRTLLAKWTDSVSVDVTISEFSVSLFEVLDDDGSFG